MNHSNLFSHLEAPKYVASAETSAKPVEHPTFSDQADTAGATNQRR